MARYVSGLLVLFLGAMAAEEFASEPPQQQKLDLLVWGATGFTGQWAVEYLLKQYGANPESFKWGIGGRSQSKLEGLKKGLTSLDPAAVDLPVVTGDGNSLESMKEVAKSTRVVVTTAGPYAQFGNELVKACVTEGTHYADITGETLWMAENIEKYNDAARKKQVKIVHTAGFDSVPSDIGTLMMVTYIKEKFQRTTKSVKTIFADVLGGVSGGTIASLFGQLAQASEAGGDLWKRFKNDMYLLNPKDRKPDWDKSHGGFGYDKTTSHFTSGFIMAPINARVVRRSNALQDHAYGSPFHYSEVSGGKGFSGLVKSVLTSAISTALDGVLAFKPARPYLQKILPKPGENPSRELCEKGYFWAYLIAEAHAEPGEEPVKVIGRMGTNGGDGGYKETAHMLVESGLTMALDQDKTPRRFGVLTPAAGLGLALLDRLRGTGFTFEVLPPGSPLPENIRPAEGKEEL